MREALPRLGVKPENMTMVDSKGIVTSKRMENGELNEYKSEFARDVPEGGIREALDGADVFLGLSKEDYAPDMIKSMKERPLIFALANPDPEITPEQVSSVRDDAIVATGRSDYPNQITTFSGSHISSGGPWMFELAK